MAEFTQNIESHRFLQVIDELISRKIVDSAAEFCRKVNFDTRSFSHIRTGKRNVPIELIGKLYSVFSGNPIFIVSGKGNLLVDDNHSTSDEIQRLNSIIDSMISNVQVNIQYVKSLEEKIRILEGG